MGVDNGRDANPFDDSWDDDGWDLYDGSDDGYWPPDDEALWADAELDGRVRQQLATLVPLRHEAVDRWDEIQPRMTRARRRRHASQALATSVLVAAVALAGVQGAGRFLPEDTSVVSAADGGDDMSTSDSQRPMVGIGEASSTIAADGGTATPSSGDDAASPEGDPADGQGALPPDNGPATDTPGVEETSLSGAGAVPGSLVGSSVPVNGGSAASSVSIPPPTANTPTTAAAPVTNSPTFRSTTTTRATTARATTTTTRATTTSTSVVTVRDFSTIDVTVRGSEIRLVAVHNASGVTSQVHNSGPEKIEITFTKGSEKHALVATVRNGNVVTSIVDSDDD